MTQKLNQKHFRPHVIDSSTIKALWLLGRWSSELRSSYADTNMVYSLSERVFNFEHYFESFGVVREEFGS